MFNTALSLVLRFEGGYADDPLDAGGATNFGITHATYHRYRAAKKLPLRSVRDITQEEVREIYERSYWDAAQCNLFDDTHPHTAAIHFDCAVNCGTVTAIKMLQEQLRVPVDGMFGKVTLAALKATKDDTIALLLLKRRRLYYLRIVDRKPSQRRFISSWFHRLDRLARFSNIAWKPTDE